DGRGARRPCSATLQQVESKHLEASRAAYAGGDLAEPPLVPVAEAWTLQARMRCPAAAAQHVVRAEPRRRVAVIGVSLEARVRFEPTRGPFPDLTAPGKPGASRGLPFGLAGRPPPRYPAYAPPSNQDRQLP